jgi:hypothetical protein
MEHGPLLSSTTALSSGMGNVRVKSNNGTVRNYSRIQYCTHRTSSEKEREVVVVQ